MDRVISHSISHSNPYFSKLSLYRRNFKNEIIGISRIHLYIHTYNIDEYIHTYIQIKEGNSIWVKNERHWKSSNLSKWNRSIYRSSRRSQLNNIRSRSRASSLRKNRLSSWQRRGSSKRYEREVFRVGSPSSFFFLDSTLRLDYSSRSKLVL